MLVEQRPQVLAHVAGPVENPIQEPRPIPERLPAQCPIALVVDARPFKLMAFDFDFGVIKKYLRLPGVQPPSRLGLLAGPVHQLRVDAVHIHHALFGLGPQPFAQRGLIRAFNQPEQVHEHAVLPQALGIGKGGPATGKGEEQLGRVGHGRKSRTGAFTRVQRGRLVDAFP